jgi:RNA-binding protein Musashi
MDFQITFTYWLGFGFLSFDNEDTIDKVVAEHFVNISGKQVNL